MVSSQLATSCAMPALHNDFPRLALLARRFFVSFQPLPLLNDYGWLRHVISKSSSTIDSSLAAKLMFLRHNKDLLSDLRHHSLPYVFALVFSCHGAVLAVRNRVYRAQIVGIAQGGLTKTMCHRPSQYVRDLSFFPWTFFWSMVDGPIPKKSMESMDLMGIYRSIALQLYGDICPRTRVIQMSKVHMSLVHITEFLLY